MSVIKRRPMLAAEIDRRLLVNYSVDPAVAAAVVPAPFRPQLVNDRAVAGICLIRLRRLRPAGLPPWLGLTSENAARRIAVEWDSPAGLRTGVYIPRRDSNSLVGVAVGGRAYPGALHRARFELDEDQRRIRIAFRAQDSFARVDVSVSDRFPPSELFANLAEASAFFQRGCDGYSATRRSGSFDGLRLLTPAWSVEPTRINQVDSSWFADSALFPPGSAVLDNALLMRDISVRWQPLDPFAQSSPAPALVYAAADQP